MSDHSFRPNTQRARRVGQSFPARYRPMLMESVATPFNKKNWIFEPKLDGMRGLVTVSPTGCTILSRNGLDFAFRYPALAAQLKDLGTSAVIDGEIVAFDSEGRVSFEALQQRIRLTNPHEIAAADRTNPVVFYFFDLLELKGETLLTRPLLERRDTMLASVEERPLVRKVECYAEDGISLFEACVRTGFEGIVGKDAASRYQCGVRSKHWIKVKHTQTADVVIAGHKTDVGFLVGRYDESGALKYAGSVVGGLRTQEHEALDSLLKTTRSCPFQHDQVKRWNATWFEPRVVAEVKFMHWTSGGYLRMPSFVRLRFDLSAAEVVSPDKIPELQLRR